ncbi:MAG TPA: 2-dehydropantoate 2-reductase [Kofleriaceae bacterium]|nr:2-dehydropantoate 2-reductase [Kofleriaceae bacterium]
MARREARAQASKAAAGARVLVMGAGGIGGIVAGSLAAVGVDVVAVSTNAEIREAVARDGFRLHDEGRERRVPGRIEAAPPAGERFDVVVLATQPPQVEDAARTALPALADGGVMVVLQNGLCEARVARLVGEPRVIGAIVAWGASMPSPGRYDRTAAGGFTIGRLSGAPDEACRRVADLLEAVGPTTLTDNLWGARWSKLALNCAISSLGTIAGERLGPLVRVRRYRRLALEIMTEAVAVARREGVKLEKVAGTLDLEWVALTDAERTARGSAGLTAKHALLLAVGLRYRRMRSSMLAAIERGRVPAVDFLNGEIAERARAAGVTAPLNARVVELVHAIAAGRETSSRALLDRLFDETR